MRGRRGEGGWFEGVRMNLRREEELGCGIQAIIISRTTDEREDFEACA